MDYNEYDNYENREQSYRNTDYYPNTTEPPRYYYNNGNNAAPQGTPPQQQPPKKKGRAGKAVLGVAMAALVVTSSLSTALALDSRSDIEALSRQVNALQQQTSYNTDQVSTDNLSTPGLDSIQNEINRITNAVTPSIVGIRVTGGASGSMYFGTQGYQSEGSGIIATEDGFIITNYHVVEAAVQNPSYRIEVFFSDGTSIDATYVGGDQPNDLAVVKVEKSGLTPATFGSSSDAKIGDFALTIGNPMGIDFAGSVSTGVVSGLDRNLSTDNVADSLIQITAAINPGNSGGALVNSKGEVIGINSIKIASQEVEGIGFAIPIDFAMPIVESIIDHGYVKDRPTLGISGSEVSAMTAVYYRIPQGVLIAEVTPDGSAAQAGLQVDDIIITLGDKEIRTVADITNFLKNCTAGQTVNITYYRDGETVDGTITLIGG